MIAGYMVGQLFPTSDSENPVKASFRIIESMAE